MTVSTDLPQILVIDDEIGPRESLRMLLKPDYQVHTADCVEAGMKLLKEKQPDTIVMDIRMPDMNGTEVCAKLRNRPHLPSNADRLRRLKPPKRRCDSAPMITLASPLTRAKCGT
jgi:CheY-like chemotaxis protein